MKIVLTLIAIWLGATAWTSIALVQSMRADNAAQREAADPIRYCYTVHHGQPWSCYLKADRPAGYTPVWVGRESLVKSTYFAQEDSSEA